MRLNSAAALERAPTSGEEWISTGPAPGKRPQTARFALDPTGREEPAAAASGERPDLGEAGSGSFMPPVHELVAASEDRPARGETPAPTREEKKQAGPTREEKKQAGPSREEKKEAGPAERTEAKRDQKARRDQETESAKSEEGEDELVVEGELVAISQVDEENPEAAESETDPEPPADDLGEGTGDEELLSSGFVRATEGTEERLDATAIEAELDSEIGAVDEPSGPEGLRARLTRVAQLAGTRRRAARDAIDAENAEVDLEEEAIDHRAAGRRQEGTNALEEKRRKKAADAHSGAAGRKLARTVSRDQLRNQLLSAQTEEKTRAAETLAASKVDLETRLAGQLAGLMEEQERQDEAIVAEFAEKNAALGKRIEEKRKAHEEQIEREKIAVEMTAENEKAVARAEAIGQAGDIVTSADAQAAHTLSEAQLHAGNVEAKASKEAAAAEAAGEAKAQQAIDAARERASAAAADESEEASILEEGERRANLARAQAQTRRAEIAVTGMNEAAGIRDKGSADSKAEKDRGQVESAAAIERGEAAVVRIEDERAASIATMELQSKLALAEMENERVLAMLELEQARALALTKMASELALACVKIDSERTAAVVALQAEHDKLVAAIDVRIQADLVKVDAASEKDLARLQRQVDRDLAAIDRQVSKAERTMAARVERAEARAKADVARRRVEIRKAGRAVLGAIDGLVAKAERAIDRADEDTSQEISDAANLGVQAVAAEGQEAREDNRTASETAIREQEQAAQAARIETGELASDASQAMEDDRKALDGEIDQQWVDDALARSGELLSRDGTDWAVSDEESVEAMHLMASLPPHLQGQVIDGLSDDQFDELLSEMDEERHEHLAPLVDGASEPRRKLELFAASHASKVQQDAIRAEDGWMGAIAEETEVEMKDELHFLLAKDPLTDQDVKDLIARKELEHQIEEQFRVNLTNERAGVLPWDDEVDANGDKIVWREGELLELQAILGEMPEAHVRGNTMLEEIRREDLAYKDIGEPEAQVGADHGDGRIRVYNAGNDPRFSYRHTGDTPESGDPNAGRGPGGGISQLEEVLIHETGHDIHDLNPEAFAAFQAAGGWEKGLDEDDLSGRGLSDDAIEDIEDNENAYPVDGRVYESAYGDFISYDAGRIPTTGQGGDTWSYARTGYHDHFAETYAKAVLVPEQLAKDLLDGPADRVAEWTLKRDLAAAARDTAKANLAALNATSPPPPLETLVGAYQEWLKSEAAAARQQHTLDETTADQEGMKEQYRIMREDIFHTGEEVEAARARLEAKGITPARLQDFLDKAARLATPEQVKRLETQYP